jgi:hypothetical protein
MTPKIWASIEAIRAISHQFVQCQTAIRWLEWLHRKLSSECDQRRRKHPRRGLKEKRVRTKENGVSEFQTWFL